MIDEERKSRVMELAAMISSAPPPGFGDLLVTTGHYLMIAQCYADSAMAMPQRDSVMNADELLRVATTLHEAAQQYMNIMDAANAAAVAWNTGVSPN